MSEQPTIKLPAEDGPTPDADAFLKKALGKQPAGLLLFLAFGQPNDH